MRLKKHTIAFVMMSITSLWGCAPTEEEKRQAEEEEKNKPSLSIQPVGTLVEPDETSLLTSATVIMSKTVDDNVTFKYSLNGVTASPGSDFEAKSGTLTIPSGSNSATIELIILADNIDEQDEEFTITLSSPTNAKLGIASETVVIQDSILDVKPVISIQPVTPLQEPDEGSITYSATVTLSSITSLPVSLAYSFHDGTADSGDDFDGTAGVLEIAPGSDSAVIDITINSDEVDELVDEDFSINLSSLINATPGVMNQTVVIIDSVLDVTPVISIEPVDSLQEPDSGTSTYSATVVLSSITSFPVSVDYSLDSVSADSGLDFEASSGTLNFPTGTNSAEIDLIIKADDIDEFDENFTITLKDPINATVGGTEEVIILDSNEDRTTMSFATDSVRVAESSGEYKVKLVLTHASEKNISIPFTTGGLATKGQDYFILTPNPIKVPLNTNEVDIEFNFVADNILEGGESLILQLGSPDNAELGESNTFTFTIASDVTLNDTGVITWYDGSNFASEVRPVNSFPGQDADFGHDTDDNDDLDGADAFSFTNLDAAGEPTSDTSEARCVQDNRTGLVFELKQELQTLPTNIGDALKKELEADPLSYEDAHVNWQAANFTYYWLNTDETTNAGDIGEQGITFGSVNADYPVSSICAFPYKGMLDHDSEYDSCNTQVYTAAINDFGLCGFTDWKLPTIEQLRSIHNYRDITLPIKGTEFFPNNVSGDYISATPSADGAKTAWCISSDTGRVGLCKKNTPSYVRMVRGGAQ